MATPFLTIKLYIPPVPPELVSPSRLVERFNAGIASNPLLLTSRRR
jgi:hypothetical protein